MKTIWQRVRDTLLSMFWRKRIIDNITTMTKAGIKDTCMASLAIRYHNRTIDDILSLHKAGVEDIYSASLAMHHHNRSLDFILTLHKAGITNIYMASLAMHEHNRSLDDILTMHKAGITDIHGASLAMNNHNLSLDEAANPLAKGEYYTLRYVSASKHYIAGCKQLTYEEVVRYSKSEEAKQHADNAAFMQAIEKHQLTLKGN